MDADLRRLIEQPFASGLPSQALAVVKAKALPLQAGDPLHRALSIIAGGCLEHLRGNEAGACLGADPESVHQMRVGLRRLRAALRLFEPVAVLPPPLHQELLWLGSELGAARDWEVLAEETLADWLNGLRTAGRPGGEAATRLLLAAREAAAQGRDAARGAVASERYARLVWNLVIWVQRLRGHDGEAVALTAAAARGAPLATVAEAWLEAAWLRLQRRARRLNRATASQRHHLRIAAKKMRYATEFFQGLHEPTCVRPFLLRLAELQEVLGRLNDAEVAPRLLQRLVDGQPDLAGPARRVRQWLDRCQREDLRRLPVLWRRCDEAALPWP
jgi:CHAD domain-containing protein